VKGFVQVSPSNPPHCRSLEFNVQCHGASRAADCFTFILLTQKPEYETPNSGAFHSPPAVGAKTAQITQLTQIAQIAQNDPLFITGQAFTLFIFHELRRVEAVRLLVQHAIRSQTTNAARNTQSDYYCRRQYTV
jgi:hypothetical protein